MIPSPVLSILLPMLLAGSASGPAGSRAGAPPPAPPAAAPKVAAIRVTLETIAVDRRGTWSVGSDVADIFPGSTGVLEKSATLIGRQEVDPPREMVQLKARIAPSLKEGAACALRIDAETRRVISGTSQAAHPRGVERQSAAVLLKEDEERLVEVYSSPITQARLALKVRCEPARPAGEPELRFIDFTLSMSRSDSDKELEVLKSNRLRASLGREASDLASYNIPLPEGPHGDRRYRKEELEVTLVPVLISGGQIQIEVRVHGALSTVSGTDPAVRHPVEHKEILVLSSGEPHAIDLEVPSSDAAEGWSGVRYRFDVVPSF